MEAICGVVAQLCGGQSDSGVHSESPPWGGGADGCRDRWRPMIIGWFSLNTGGWCDTSVTAAHD
jgi:hypothetical protein